jgi:PKD repeat protein
MKKKKILIGMIVLMFIFSTLPVFIGQAEDTNEFQERKYKENRNIIPVYTKNGIKHHPATKGKPGAYVIIEEPASGATVSGTVTIVVNSNYNPTITVDGGTIGSGSSCTWDTIQYADGSHTIQAAARGVTDTVMVTVANGGGGENDPPIADFSYSISELTVDFTDESTDSDGSISSWYWEFGDGETSTGQNPTYTYATDDTYTVSLTVTDNGGAQDTTSKDVTVSSGSGGNVNKYALVIGISDYDGTANDLTYCDDDAMDWKNFLQGEGYSVTTLIDGQATADNIEAELYDLLAAEDEDDYVVLTYSGHGTSYRNYGSCIISQDLYYMTHGYFEQFFDTADSQHIYFAFDACKIGDFQGLVNSNRVGAFASDNSYSYDGTGDMDNGVFTYYQMQGWDSYSTFEEDADYAVQGMENWASYYSINVDPFYVDQFTGAMLP